MMAPRASGRSGGSEVAEVGGLNEPIKSGEREDLPAGSQDQSPHVLTTHAEPSPVDASYDFEGLTASPFALVADFSKVHEPGYLVPGGSIIVG